MRPFGIEQPGAVARFHRGGSPLAIKLKWQDVDDREYLEVTTERLGYHWTGSRGENTYGHWLASAGRSVGSKKTPWVAEFKPADEWVFVGEFHTGREAKAAVIKAYRDLITEGR